MYRNVETIILASGSPRRKKFLSMMGLDFTIQAASIVEEQHNGEVPDEFVRRMAFEKGVQISRENPLSWVISADTVVCLENRIFGKPTSVDDAAATLMELSGKKHLVKSGFCLNNFEREIVFEKVVTTTVEFWNFSENIAKAYACTCEPLDKAGAYGIQEKGAQLVKEIQGSYTNVVGLPLSELMEQLLIYGVIESI